MNRTLRLLKNNQIYNNFAEENVDVEFFDLLDKAFLKVLDTFFKNKIKRKMI